MADFGLSFLPNPNDPNRVNGDQAAVEPVQTAVKYLSFRVPKFPQGAVLAPPSLLTGAGAQGSPFARNAIGQTQPNAFRNFFGNEGRFSMGGQGDPLAQALAILAGMSNQAPSIGNSAPPTSTPPVRINPGERPGVPGNERPITKVDTPMPEPPAPAPPPSMPSMTNDINDLASRLYPRRQL